MALTEAQLLEAKAELDRREAERSKRYAQETARRWQEENARHRAKMEAKYPGISWDTMFEIFSDMYDYYY